MTATVDYRASDLAVLASLEDRHFWFRSRRRIIIDAIARRFPNARTYLELGAGTGYNAQGIANAFPNLRVLATDPHPGYTDVHIDARHIPFENAFDLIGAYDVLEHIEDDALALRQIHKALKPGGGILLTVPQHPALWSPADTYAQHHRRYTARSLKRQLRDTGFEILTATSLQTLTLPAFAARALTLRALNRPPTHKSPTPVLNALFEALMSVDQALINSGLTLPIGASLLIAAQKSSSALPPPLRLRVESPAPGPPVTLSIVTTVYRTAQFLQEFSTRAIAAAEACGYQDYELLFVIDGSPDDALPTLRRLKSLNPRIRAIELSRNFGHHPALWCGLEQARGDLIFLADADLETAPEILTDLHAALTEDIDAAFAYRETRTDSPLSRFASQAFWRIFSILAEVRMHPNILTERLMRRPYVNALLAMNERTLFLGGMMEWIGFRQTPVPAQRTQRPGPPSYTFGRRAALAFDAITSFSTAPMKLLFFAGAALATLAMFGAMALIALKLFFPGFVLQGFTALAVLLLFALGSILAAIGLVGLYLGKVFLQTKARPLYLIRDEF